MKVFVLLTSNGETIAFNKLEDAQETGDTIEQSPEGYFIAECEVQTKALKSVQSTEHKMH